MINGYELPYMIEYFLQKHRRTGAFVRIWINGHLIL